MQSVGSALLMALLAFGLWAGGAAAQEIQISAEDYAKLDPFEAQRLAEANKSFDSKDWRQALAGYNAFLLEFPRSLATPYALLRKGRATQYDNKMLAAIDVYNEIMDYFPNNVPYAAPALFYMGECRWANGDHKEALKLWKELAEDVDYRKHWLAAFAMNTLAGELMKTESFDEAAKYYLQTANDFRDSNWNAVSPAMNQLFAIWVKLRPNVKSLQAACKTLGGFENNRRADLADNEGYFWGKTRYWIRQHGNFPDAQRTQRIDYYTYWSKAMEGRFPEDDDYQKDLADFYMYADGNGDKWRERLDKQFEAYQKPGDNARVIKWMMWMLGSMPKVEQYFTKIDFAKMNNDGIWGLVVNLFDNAQARPLAKRVYLKLQFDKYTDANFVAIARHFWDRDESFVLDACGRIKDGDLGKMELLRYWGRRQDVEKSLPLADKCVMVPAYAKEAYWIKADMLRKAGKLEEAIAAYQASDSPPQSLYAIADCLVSLGRIEPAVAQLREIEGFFADQAPVAAYKVAQVYSAAGQREKYVGALTAVLKKYPKSGQASQAHNELEGMGLGHLIRSGVEAE